MHNYLINILLLALLAAPAWPQAEDTPGGDTDSATTGEEDSAAQAAGERQAEEENVSETAADTAVKTGQQEESVADDAEDSGDSEGEVDDSDLDVQTYEKDEDIFVPTEEIPADEPIPFPSNI